TVVDVPKRVRVKRPDFKFCFVDHAKTEGARCIKILQTS
ncbi:MAG: hypothetical protein ACI814_004121, partial [Mariniblastus sp.]